MEDLVDPISIFAGVVQTGLYLDFFYVYFTKYASLPPYRSPTRTHTDAPSLTECFKAKNSNYQHDILRQRHYTMSPPRLALGGPAAKIKLFLDWPLLTIHTLVHIYACHGANNSTKLSHNHERHIPALELYTTMLNEPSPCGTPSTVGSMR